MPVRKSVFGGNDTHRFPTTTAAAAAVPSLLYPPRVLSLSPCARMRVRAPISTSRRRKPRFPRRGTGRFRRMADRQPLLRPGRTIPGSIVVRPNSTGTVPRNFLVANVTRKSATLRPSRHVKMVWLVANFLGTSWRRRQQVRKEVTRKLMTSRGSYEELVPMEFGPYAAMLRPGTVPVTS